MERNVAPPTHPAEQRGAVRRSSFQRRPRSIPAMRRWGSRWLGLGGILFALGLIIVLVASGTIGDGVGIGLFSLACIATAIGIGLLGATLVESRAEKRRPYA